MSLGRSAVQVSRLGFGCAAIGGYDYGEVDDRESLAAVRRAAELGITLFDTADVYGFGHAEGVLARGLGALRAGVTIATKVGVAWDEQGNRRRDLSAGWVRRALEGSLRRLGVDQIGLYQLHWLDGVTPLHETLEALERAREAGQVGLLGICNVTGEQLAAAQAIARFETVQLPFSLLDTTHLPVVDEAFERHGMTMLAYNVLGQGLLAGRYNSGSAFRGTDLRARSESFQGEALATALKRVALVRRVAEACGRSPAQVALRWVVERLPGAVALAGAKRPGQVEENVGAMGWQLPPEARHALDELAHSFGDGTLETA